VRNRHCNSRAMPLVMLWTCCSCSKFEASLGTAASSGRSWLVAAAAMFVSSSTHTNQKTVRAAL